MSVASTEKLWDVEKLNEDIRLFPQVIRLHRI